MNVQISQLLLSGKYGYYAPSIYADVKQLINNHFEDMGEVFATAAGEATRDALWLLEEPIHCNHWQLILAGCIHNMYIYIHYNDE